MSKSLKILVADDEPDILEFMRYNLEKEGFTIYTASNGRKVLELLPKTNPDLIILDIMMPELDGVETCREIRSNPMYANILIIFLTARNEDYSQIAAFSAGADDYITKPIRPRVLVSRIGALLRRRYGVGSLANSDTESTESTSQDTVWVFGELKIDREKVLVFREDREIILARKEFEILCLLCTKPKKVFSREEIYREVWGSDVIVGNRTIDVHIRKLREKIGEDLVYTVKGMGYKFDG